MKNVLRCPLLLGGQILLAGCGDGAPDTTAPPSNIDPTIPPVVQGSWYRPPVDVTWQWQLSGSINTAYAVDLYDIDLFDSPDAVFAELHNQGQSVICYFSAGSSEAWRPDFSRLDPADMGKTLDGFSDCHAFDECDQLQIFIQRGKPVLNVEYVDDAGGANALATTVCAAAQAAGLRTLILPLDLDDAFRVTCQD